MLQQTRVETVVPYYERFLAAMPTVHALAEAPLDRVLTLWSGLGYYRRARLLHRGAREVCEGHAGVLPREPSALRDISGIGRYTAGAIASIAHDVCAPIVDGNVARVLSRLEALSADPASTPGKLRLWTLAEGLAQCDAPGDLNQALMELGATVCTPEPRCKACPVRRHCKAKERGIERRLPRTRRKKAPKAVSMRAFVVEARGAVVCGKRSASLYSGMWEPPMTRRSARSVLGLPLSAFESRGRFVHVLTHRRLDVEVLHARVTRPTLGILPDYERIELVPKSALGSRAMCRLARRVLDMAGVLSSAPR